MTSGSAPSEGAGTRTRDLRIKSPLLYRLSYASKFFITNTLCQLFKAFQSFTTPFTTPVPIPTITTTGRDADHARP